MQISLPYGRSSLSGVIPDWTATECVVSKRWHSRISEEKWVIRALEKPYGLPMLRKLARHSHSALIITCDKTRSVPTQVTLPLILKELEKGGLVNESVSILIATGLHKGETMADVRERFGNELVESLHISVHDSDRNDQLSYLATLSSDTPLFLNREAVENDLVIIESVVEPHFFAGFAGGSKVILPGIAGTETILRNHCWQNVDDPRSRYGVLENPIRADANETLRFLKRTFALNLVLNGQKQIVYATGGEPIVSFRKAAEMVAAHSTILINNSPDLVITTNGGYPLDRNLYQCVKGIAVPEQVLLPGSRIIMVGECSDGIAHEEFRRILVERSPSELYAGLKTSDVLVRDQWEVQVLCRILCKNSVWFVTRRELRSDIESMHMHYAATIEDALDSSRISKGERVLVVPEGPSAILRAR
jgi:nickel-dependent lactate racemase